MVFIGLRSKFSARRGPRAHPLRRRHELIDLQARSGSRIHQSVEAKLINLALQQRVQAWLSKTGGMLLREPGSSRVVQHTPRS